MAAPVVDYYAELGIKQKARPDEIERAYRALAAQYDPSRIIGRPETEREYAAQKLAAVKAAHDVLIDPEKRAQYHANNGYKPLAKHSGKGKRKKQERGRRLKNIYTSTDVPHKKIPKAWQWPSWIQAATMALRVRQYYYHRTKRIMKAVEGMQDANTASILLTIDPTLALTHGSASANITDYYDKDGDKAVYNPFYKARELDELIQHNHGPDDSFFIQSLIALLREKQTALTAAIEASKDDSKDVHERLTDLENVILEIKKNVLDQIKDASETVVKFSNKIEELEADIAEVKRKMEAVEELPPEKVKKNKDGTAKSGKLSGGTIVGRMAVDAIEPSIRKANGKVADLKNASQVAAGATNALKDEASREIDTALASLNPDGIGRARAILERMARSFGDTADELEQTKHLEALRMRQDVRSIVGHLREARDNIVDNFVERYTNKWVIPFEIGNHYKINEATGICEKEPTWTFRRRYRKLSSKRGKKALRKKRLFKDKDYRKRYNALTKRKGFKAQFKGQKIKPSNLPKLRGGPWAWFTKKGLWFKPWEDSRNMYFSSLDKPGEQKFLERSWQTAQGELERGEITDLGGRAVEIQVEQMAELLEQGDGDEARILEGLKWVMLQYQGQDLDAARRTGGINDRLLKEIDERNHRLGKPFFSDRLKRKLRYMKKLQESGEGANNLRASWMRAYLFGIYPRYIGDIKSEAAAKQRNEWEPTWQRLIGIGLRPSEKELSNPVKPNFREKVRIALAGEGIPFHAFWAVHTPIRKFAVKVFFDKWGSPFIFAGKKAAKTAFFTVPFGGKKRQFFIGGPIVAAFTYHATAPIQCAVEYGIQNWTGEQYSIDSGGRAMANLTRAYNGIVIAPVKEWGGYDVNYVSTEWSGKGFWGDRHEPVFADRKKDTDTDNDGEGWMVVTWAKAIGSVFNGGDRIDAEDPALRERIKKLRDGAPKTEAEAGNMLTAPPNMPVDWNYSAPPGEEGESQDSEIDVPEIPDGMSLEEWMESQGTPLPP